MSFDRSFRCTRHNSVPRVRWAVRVNPGSSLSHMTYGLVMRISTKRVRRQKTDREDAQVLLKLLHENNSPRVGHPVGKS